MIILKQDDWLNKPGGGTYAIGDKPTETDDKWGYSGLYESAFYQPRIVTMPSGVFNRAIRFQLRADDTLPRTAAKRSEYILKNVPELQGGRRFHRHGSPTPWDPEITAYPPTKGYIIAGWIYVDPLSTFFTHSYSGAGYREGTSGIIWQMHDTQDSDEGGRNPVSHLKFERFPDVAGGTTGRCEFKIAGDDRKVVLDGSRKWGATFLHPTIINLGQWFCFIWDYEAHSWQQNKGIANIWVRTDAEALPTAATPPDHTFTIANASNDKLATYAKSNPGIYAAFFQQTGQWYQNMDSIVLFQRQSYIQYNPTVAGDRTAALNATLSFLVPDSGTPTPPPPPAAWSGEIYIGASAAEGQTFLKSSSTPLSPKVEPETNATKAEWFLNKQFEDTPDSTATSSPFDFVDGVTPSVLPAGPQDLRLRVNDTITRVATFNIIDDTGGGPTTLVSSTFNEGDGAIINTSPGTVSDSRNKWRAPAGTSPTVPDINGGKLRFDVLGETVYNHIHDGRPKKFTIECDFDPKNKDSRIALLFGLTTQPKILNFAQNDMHGFGLMLVHSLVSTGTSGPNMHLQRLGMDREDRSGVWAAGEVVTRLEYTGITPNKANFFRTVLNVDFAAGTAQVTLNEYSDSGYTTLVQNNIDATFFEIDQLLYAGNVIGIGAKKVQDATAFYVTRFKLDVEEYF